MADVATHAITELLTRRVLWEVAVAGWRAPLF